MPTMLTPKGPPIMARNKVVSPPRLGASGAYEHKYDVTYTIMPDALQRTGHSRWGQPFEAAVKVRAETDFKEELENFGETPIGKSFKVVHFNDSGRDQLNVRVTFDGQPVNGLPVSPDEEDQPVNGLPDEDPYGMWPLGRPEGVEDTPNPGPSAPFAQVTKNDMTDALQEAAEFLAPFSDVRKAAHAALRILQVMMTPSEFSLLDTRREKLGEKGLT